MVLYNTVVYGGIPSNTTGIVLSYSQLSNKRNRCNKRGGFQKLRCTIKSKWFYPMTELALKYQSLPLDDFRMNPFYWAP